MSDPDPDWPFDQAPNVAAMTCRTVLEGSPILLVTHDIENDGWQFLDGNDVDEAEGRVIGMGTALRLDATLREIAHLPVGWIAWRASPAHPWQRRPQP